MKNTKTLSSVVFLEMGKKLSGDIYLIALPLMVEAFATTSHALQRCLTIFLIGALMAQFFAGPLADYFGRRRILLLGLPVYVFGAFICAFAQHIAALYLGIFFISIGIGFSPALAKAIIQDIYGKVGKTAKILAFTGMLVVWAPALAMIIGGHLTSLMGWRANFYFLIVLGIVIFVYCLWALPKAPRPVKKKFQLEFAYGQLVKNRDFLMPLLGLALITSGMFVYFSSAFFLYINTWHLSPSVVGYFSLLIVAGNLSGKMLTVTFGQRITAKWHTYIALGLVIGASLLMLLLSLYQSNFLCVLIPMILYTFGMGSLLPVTRARAFACLPDKSSSAASLMGILFAGAGALSSLVISYFHSLSAMPMAVTLLVMTTLAAVIVLFPRRSVS